MRRIHWLCLLLSAYGAAQAAPVLTLDPANGAIAGLAGSRIGWGFTLTSDAAVWISVVSSSLTGESDPTLGSYIDWIGMEGGPTNGILAPGAQAWTEAFSLASVLGAGAFAIDAAAQPGRMDTGTLDVQYERFSADPNTCGSCAVGFGELLAPFSVGIAAAPSAAPEPWPGWLMGCGLLATGALRRLLQRTNALNNNL